MLASAIVLAAARPKAPRWLLGRRTACQFASIIFLALASFGLSALVGERTWNARSWVGHTRDVQLAIDRIIVSTDYLRDQYWKTLKEHFPGELGLGRQPAVGEVR